MLWNKEIPTSFTFSFIKHKFPTWPKFWKVLVTLLCCSMVLPNMDFHQTMCQFWNPKWNTVQVYYQNMPHLAIQILLSKPQPWEQPLEKDYKIYRRFSLVPKLFFHRNHKWKSRSKFQKQTKMQKLKYFCLRAFYEIWVNGYTPPIIAKKIESLLLVKLV